MKSLFALAIIFLLLAIWPMMVSSSPPVVPCTEVMIKNETSRLAVLSNPLLAYITRELDLYEVLVGGCPINDSLKAILHFRLPASYSSFGISYAVSLPIILQNNGSIYLIDADGRYFTQSSGIVIRVSPFDGGAVMRGINVRINEIENDSRVKEFVGKLGHTATVSLLDNKVKIYAKEVDVGFMNRSPGYLEYSQDGGIVTGYLLPNNIKWENFPEIAIAKDAISRNLTNCSVIDNGFGYEHTVAQFHDWGNYPWFLKVGVNCKRMNPTYASVRVNADGSTESPTIEIPINTRNESPIPRLGPLEWFFLLGTAAAIMFIFFSHRSRKASEMIRKSSGTDGIFSDRAN